MLSSRLGKCGSAEAFERGRLANENPPRLRTHDRQGRRLDRVDYHPAYHACMEASCAAGLHSRPGSTSPAPDTGRGPVPTWRAPPVSHMAAQMEAGHCCPVTMTNAAVATLRLEPALAEAWLPLILARAYDGRFIPAPTSVPRPSAWV